MSIPCPFCGVGCKLDPSGKPLGSFCPRALGAFEFFKRNKVERPLLRVGDHYEEISLEEAAEIASEWIKRRTYFVGSAEDTNENAWLLQKIARYLGTNDVDHCGRVCHSPSVEAYRRLFGVPLTPFKLGEPIKDLLIVGSDVSITYPVLWQKVRGYGKVIAVDAWESFTMRQADDYMIIPPGPGFLAFAEVIYSHEFGIEAPRWVHEWVDVEMVKELWKGLDEPSLIHGMGVTHSGYGLHAVLRLSLATLKRGGKILTLRGKANVQGAGDMGLNPWPPAPIDELERLWGFRVPREFGNDLVQAFEVQYDTYFIHSQNVIASLPSSHLVAEKLERAKVIQLTPKLNETSIFADLIVPSSPLVSTHGTITRGDGMVYSINAGENLGFEFLKILSEKLGLNVEDVKETTREAFEAVHYYKVIDVDKLYSGEDQYVKKPTGWSVPELEDVQIFREHTLEGHWLYTARDPALWTTKGADPLSERRKLKEAIYLNLDEFDGCERVRVCSPHTGECIEGDAVLTSRVPRGTVVVFFNHVGLRVNTLVPQEPRDPSGAPMYKAVKVKVTCLNGRKGSV